MKKSRPEELNIVLEDIVYTMLKKGYLEKEIKFKIKNYSEEYQCIYKTKPCEDYIILSLMEDCNFKPYETYKIMKNGEGE